MNLWRNYVDQRFCPVLWLIIWLHLSGIKKGPIFCRIDGSGAMKSERKEERRTDQGTYDVWFDAAGKQTSMDAQIWEGMIGRAFFEVDDLKECTPHSIRKSAAMWAARGRGTRHPARRLARRR